jgi:hypothetical protein
MTPLTPQRCLADLDRMLADRGNTITLRRKDGVGGFLTVDCLAVDLNYSDPQLAGNITQDAYNVILSPTPLTAWTPPLPLNTDQVYVQGRWRAVEAVVTKMVRDVAVRIELRAVG